MGIRVPKRSHADQAHHLTDRTSRSEVETGLLDTVLSAWNLRS